MKKFLVKDIGGEVEGADKPINLDNRIVLEDNNEYVVLKELDLNNNHYLFLNNFNNPKDYVIRKKELIGGKELITQLDNEEEFNMCMKEVKNF